jgi:hypothetical protein
MNSDRRPLLIGPTLAALSLAGLVTLQIRPVVHAAEGAEVEYTFDRPITQGEEIYNWYRKTHAEEAAKRYGVDPDAVGDGMDTWCGPELIIRGFGGTSPHLPVEKAAIHSTRGSIS